MSAHAKKIILVGAGCFSPPTIMHLRMVSETRDVYNWVIHLPQDLGWVDFHLGVPPSCQAAQPLLPNSDQPRQNWADSGTPKIRVNPTQVLGQMNRPVYAQREAQIHKQRAATP